MFTAVSEVPGGKDVVRLDAIPGLTSFDPAEPPPAAGAVGWFEPATSQYEYATASTSNSGSLEWGYYPRLYAGLVGNPETDTGMTFELETWEPVVPGDPNPEIRPWDYFGGMFNTCEVQFSNVMVSPPDEEGNPAVYRMAPGTLKIRGRAAGGGLMPGRLVVTGVYQPDSAEYWYGFYAWSWEPTT